MKDGFYLKSHPSWKGTKKSATIEYISKNLTPRGIAVEQVVKNGFTYEPVTVLTARELDELMLNAYRQGHDSLPYDPSLLQWGHDN